MDDQEKRSEQEASEPQRWSAPLILQSGHIEAKLFSDEPDPWGP